ncbi:glycosyltransferase family 2 protein [Yeosuana sp. AK3]
MKLSIIVPCYNGENHIIRCLNSLINQDLAENEFEIIVIDDGSTDNSKKVVEDFKKKHKNITLYSQINQGLGAVRNRGMEIAQGDYIYFLDCDDYLAYNTLGTILKYLIKFDLDLLGFKTIVTEALDLFKSNTKSVSQDEIISKGVDFMLKNKFHRYEAWWYIIKKEYLQESGFKFEEGKFMEDVIFTFKILIEAKRFMFLPIDVHRYFKNPNSIMNNESQEHLMKLIEDYVNLIFKFNDLIEYVSKKNSSTSLKILENIKHTRSVFTYFIFFKLIRAKISIKSINSILKKLKKGNAYPFKNLIGEQYNHKKMKVSTFIFNNKWLFFLLLHPLRFLYKKRLINLP